jgi:hypothetical protein
MIFVEVSRFLNHIFILIERITPDRLFRAFSFSWLCVESSGGGVLHVARFRNPSPAKLRISRLGLTR